MLQRHKLLNSENHVSEDVGDVSPLVRTTYEDALVQALEDTILDNNLKAFRSFVRKHQDFWPGQVASKIHQEDDWGWYTVYYYTCTLRRMAPRWEHAANKLMSVYGMSPQEIPPGTEWLHL